MIFPDVEKELPETPIKILFPVRDVVPARVWLADKEISLDPALIV